MSLDQALTTAAVVVLDGVRNGHLDDLRDRTGGGADAHVDVRDGGDEAATIAALRDADVVVVRNLSTISAAVLDACPRLRVVARVGVGLDNIDVEAADRAGVVVLSPRGANATSVAEHALGLALALARRTVPVDRSSRAGGWDRVPGRELAGSTWGVLGAGATGRAVARLAAALDLRVLGHDPFADDADVRAQEPPVTGGLEARDDVVLTPHVGGVTVQSQDRIVRLLVEDVVRLLAGDDARHAVGQARRVTR